jgi:bacteriorhodopsin
MLSMTEGGSMLAVATTALFILGFVGMAAGTLYFLLERNELKAANRGVAVYAAIITFVATIMYFMMMNLALAGGVPRAMDGSPLATTACRSSGSSGKKAKPLKWWGSKCAG